MQPETITRRHRSHPAVRWSARTFAFAALALLGVGCSGGSGPDISVAPKYQATAQKLAPAEGQRSAVAVVVTDGRKTKGVTRERGEIIARGDQGNEKGKIFAERPLAQLIDEHVRAALQRGGFTVADDAPVVIEVTLLDLPVEAYQFTHWTLPSERASTLDVLGAALPGPVRPTKAKVAMSVSVHRRDSRLGMSHAVTAEAANASAEREVVERTLGQVLSSAADEAVAKAGPDVDVVARTPITNREISGRSEEILKQEQALREVSAKLKEQELGVADERKALDEMKRKLDEDRRAAQTAATNVQAIAAQQGKFDTERAEVAKLKATLAAERKDVEQQRARLAEEQTAAAAKRRALEEQLAQLAKKPETAPGVKEALAQAAQQRQALDARDAELKRTAASLQAWEKESAARDKQFADREKALAEAEKAFADRDKRLAAGEKAFAEREQNLVKYEAKLKEQAAAGDVVSRQLVQQQQDLALRERDLQQWKKDLEAAKFQPPPTVAQNKRPLVVITDPASTKNETTLPKLTVSGVAVDDRKISGLRAVVNGQALDLRRPAGPATREGIKAVGLRSAADPALSAGNPGTADETVALQRFSFDADLREGNNEIVVEASDDENVAGSQKLNVTYDKGTGRIHIIAIGINLYKNEATVPPLRYAVSDAKGIATTLDGMLSDPNKNVRQMLDGQASRQELMDQLFYQLPSEVKPADTVVIFFSGHGAPDTTTDNQGNVETFLLPIDADPAKLFTTAIRMSDVGTMLKRLRSERIVFIADTCYSGAAGGSAGGRTVGVPGVALRAVGLRSFPRRPEGKGCAILTASTGTQVAQEKAELGHGVFSYYLMKGLKGAADRNRDGNITVDEAFDYVKSEVSAATGNAQTPQISRDPTAGEIILGRVKK